MSEKIAAGFCVLPDRSWMGGRIYIENLLRAVRLAEGRPLRSVLVCRGGGTDENASLAKLADEVLLVRDPRPPGYNTLRSVVRAVSGIDLVSRRVQRQCAAAKLDVVFPFNQRPASDSPRAIAWIPDFQHKHLPGFFTEPQLRQRDIEFSETAKHARTIVLSSEAAARDLEQFFPRAKGKAKVMRFATVPTDDWFASDPDSLRARYNLPGRYFIVCNQFWRHKNHWVVFEALAILRGEGIGAHVICTGPTKDTRDEQGRYFSELVDFLRAKNIQANVSILGLVPRSDQIALLRGAVAVVQPSLFEGWSTVLEDARVFEKKAIVSDLDVHREQDLPGAAYFDPHDAVALAREMREAWLGSPPAAGAVEKLREEAMARGKKFGARFLQIIEEEMRT